MSGEELPAGSPNAGNSSTEDMPSLTIAPQDEALSALPAGYPAIPAKASIPLGELIAEVIE
jgi:hypothetical protein